MKEPSELSLEIQKIFEEHDDEKIKELFNNYKEVDVAEALELFDDQEQILDAFRHLDEGVEARLFPYLDRDHQDYLIDQLPTTELTRLVNDLYSDDLIDIIDELPKEIVQKILDVTTKEKRQDLNRILKYDEQTVAGIMTVNFVKLEKELTVSQAMKQIRQVHTDFENVEDLFIVDEYGTLVGELKLKDLIFNQPSVKLEKIMDTSFVFAKVEEEQEDVARKFKKYDVNTLPVVDEKNTLVGIITIDDVVDVLERATTEDIQRLAGITPFNDDDPFKMSVWSMFLSRSIWLLVGIILATVTQILLVVFYNAYDLKSVLGTLDNPVSTKAYAAIFLLSPLVVVLASVCGIAINQSTNNIVRVLLIQDYDRKQLSSLVWKEVLTSLILALTLVVFNLIRLLIFYEAQFQEINTSSLWYAIATSSIALFIGIFLSGVLGAILPIAASKIKMDPTTISSPLTTGLIDIIIVGSFFGIGLAFF